MDDLSRFLNRCMHIFKGSCRRHCVFKLASPTLYNLKKDTLTFVDDDTTLQAPADPEDESRDETDEEHDGEERLQRLIDAA